MLGLQEFGCSALNMALLGGITSTLADAMMVMMVMVSWCHGSFAVSKLVSVVWEVVLLSCDQRGPGRRHKVCIMHIFVPVISCTEGNALAHVATPITIAIISLALD